MTSDLQEIKLEEISTDKELLFGKPCNHENGIWMAKIGERWYTFRGNTQMQKDTWLSEAKTEQERWLREGCLRWFCKECGTIQEP